MRLALASLLLLAACGTDSMKPPAGGPDAPMSVDAPGTTAPMDVSGHITADTTWSGGIHVVDEVFVDAGVTLTISAGTVVTVVGNQGTAIQVRGTVLAQGTSASPVTVKPDTAGQHWSGFEVPQGGVLTATYLHQLDGGIHVSSTGKVTLTDSTMSHMSGDFLTSSGGTIDVSFSAIGVEPPMTDTTHCDMHFEGATTITFTHSNVSTSTYGLMFYGGTNANFTHNNWFHNQHDIDILAAFHVSGDFSDSYFANGAPTGSGVTANNLSTTRLADCGPRS